MEQRQARIAEKRSRQPIAELERKWMKARGRHSNSYWSAEWLDLASARGRILLQKLRPSLEADAGSPA